MGEIHYFRHNVSKKGAKIDPAKLQAIEDWPEFMKCVVSLDCCYYRRFIKHLAAKAVPDDLMKKASPLLSLC